MPNRTILIVENDRSIAADLKEILDGTGYAVPAPAATCRQALAEAREHLPDLVLMDVDLPGSKDCVEAAALIRGELDIPVVFLSGNPQDPAILQAEGPGPYGCLAKPVRTHELLAAIEIAMYRHELDRKLRESEERYRRITDTITGYLYTVTVEDDKAVNTVHSPACAGVTVYTAEEFDAEADLWITMVHPDDREAVGRHADDILSGRSFNPLEHRIVRRDGQVRWVRNTPVPLHDHKGRLVSYDGLIQDITERKLAEERYRTLFETSPDPALMYDLQGKFIMVNRQTAATYGLSTPEEFMARYGNIQELLDENGRAKALKRIDSILQDRQVPSNEYTYTTPDGKTSTVEVSSSVITGLDGAPAAILSVIHDITLRNEMQGALMASEKKYRTLIEALQEGIWVVDADQVTTFVNPRMAEMLGYTVEEMVGTHMTSFMDEQGAEIAMANIERRRQGVKETYEFTFRRRDGSKMHASLAVTPLFDGQGGFAGVIAGIQDITERTQAEERTAHSNDMMRYIIEHGRSGIAVFDRDMRYVYVSQRFLREYHIQSRDVIGRSHYEVFPEIPPEWRDVHQRSLKGEVLSAEEDRFVREDGSIDWTRWECRPWYEADGSIGGIILYTEVINERKRAEESLRESKAKLEAVIQSMNDAVSISDREGNFIEFNEAFATYHKFKDKEECYRSLPEYLNYIDVYFTDGTLAPLDMWAVPRALRGETVSNAEYMLRRKDTGETWWGSYSFAPIRDRDGRIAGSVVVGRDITESKNKEEQLVSLNERLELATHAAKMGVWDWDIPNNALVWDDRMYELYGIGREDFPGAYEAWIKGLHPDDVASSHEESQRALRGEKDYDTEFRVVLPDGTIRHLKAYGQVLRDPAGNPLRMTGINFDITESKRAEGLLREREEWYRVMVEQAADAVIMHDENGRILDVNLKASQSLGYTRDELVSMSIKDVDPEAIRRDMHKLWKTVLSGESVVFESTQIRKDGSMMPVEVRLGPVRLSRGPAVLGIVRDITERKHAEAEMAKLVSVIEQAMESVIITDLHGTIQYVNPAFERRTGYTREEAIGQNSRILKSGVQDEDFYREMWETISRGDTWAGRIVNRRKNGALYHMDATISPIRDATGRIVNYVSLRKEITKEVELEEQLMRAQKLEAIGTLAGGIAHDFNNILSAIIGFSEIIRERVPGGGEIHSHITEVLKAGERARDLVKQILTFSRQVESSREPVKVHLIAKETVKFLRSSIPKNIAIVDRIDPRSGAVYGDPTKIHQVIMNLCTNAYHAMMSEGGDMTVSLKDVHFDGASARILPPLKEGSYVCLSVSDTGCGMDEVTMQRIFDPFFTTKEKGKGTGLGLATVYGIVAELGGAITVDSAPGKGSTFTVYFPLSSRMPKDELAREDEEQRPRRRGHIMVVDDEETIIHFSRLMLDQLGYTVTGMTSSSEALLLFQSAPDRYDLVITDYSMPEMNGLKLGVEMLRMRPDLPVILMTGFSETVDEKTAKRAGIRAYLEKPFTKRIISQVIEAHLGNGREGA